MKYKSGSAFRRALEDRLRASSLQTGTSLVRLRKLVAFDRFLARLTRNQPDDWVLKDGYALQLRLKDRARITKDIDLLTFVGSNMVYSALRRAGELDLEDWFSFEVTRSEEGADPGSQRYQLRALLDSRSFEIFHVDVGAGDPLVESPDHLSTPDILSFADIEPTLIPCYPLTQQIAEKLHAYTRPHLSGEGSRVKDFVDLLLIAGLGEIDTTILRMSIHATFDERGTHQLPAYLPKPPVDWARTYHKMAIDVSLSYHSLDEGYAALKKFLQPVFSEVAGEKWDPRTWVWR